MFSYMNKQKSLVQKKKIRICFTFSAANECYKKSSFQTYINLSITTAAWLLNVANFTHLLMNGYIRVMFFYPQGVKQDILKLAKTEMVKSRQSLLNYTE